MSSNLPSIADCLTSSQSCLEFRLTGFVPSSNWLPSIYFRQQYSGVFLPDILASSLRSRRLPVGVRNPLGESCASGRVLATDNELPVLVSSGSSFSLSLCVSCECRQRLTIPGFCGNSSNPPAQFIIGHAAAQNFLFYTAPSPLCNCINPLCNFIVPRFGYVTQHPCRAASDAPPARLGG